VNSSQKGVSGVGIAGGLGLGVSRKQKAGVTKTGVWTVGISNGVANEVKDGVADANAGVAKNAMAPSKFIFKRVAGSSPCVFRNVTKAGATKTGVWTVAVADAADVRASSGILKRHLFCIVSYIWLVLHV
jgi:hypothetical protein